MNANQRGNAIGIFDVSYSYEKRTAALENVSLTVPNGSIYGFLGPNGAGKTTAIRLLLGLLDTQGGVIRYFDEDFQSGKKQILYRIGSLIETPSLYQHLTAKENLEIYRLTYGTDKKRILHVLEVAGLSEVANKRVRSFSLGMKQRLGIALALLHDPDILLLDEPTNGLDPSGIIEMRKLLMELNDQYGKTIFMSSHLLDEVEKIASHVGILNKGKIMFQGTLEELIRTERSLANYQIEVDDVNLARSLLPHPAIIKIDGNSISLKYESKENVSETLAALVNNGVRVYRVNDAKPELENVFLELTK
jgi:lantibiotic transport system ATP-binding protein